MTLETTIRLAAALMALYVVTSVVTTTANACRLDAAKSQLSANKVRQLLDSPKLAAVYWPNEPLFLPTSIQAPGELDITALETSFNATSSSLVRDVFVSCEASKDRRWSLVANIELHNPFKILRGSCHIATTTTTPQHNSNISSGTIKFSLSVTQGAAFQVQLAQLLNDQSFLTVEHVTPSVDSNWSFDIECIEGCDSAASNSNERLQTLDKIKAALSKRKRLYAAVQTSLADKLAFGLAKLFSKQRM